VLGNWPRSAPVAGMSSVMGWHDTNSVIAMLQTSFPTLLLALLLIAITALTACGNDDRAASASAAGTSTTPTQQAAALSSDLQAVYDRSCKNCHSVPGSGAPQVGDAMAWAPRKAQGTDLLLEHTVNGFNAMPPLGACMDCSEEQFSALIAYMSSTKP